MTAVDWSPRLPAADVVSDAPAETPEWFAARRTGITATDLPKILGLSRYGNGLTVWHDKTGHLPPDPAGEAAHWGHLLEDVVAREWARRHDAAVHPVGTVANTTRPWMLASLDRLIDDTPAALEVKTRSAYVAGKWRDDLPDDVLAQAAWQRMVTGLDRIHVACLIGGQRLVEHTYEPDPGLEDYLHAAADTAWRQVQDGTPPPADMDLTLARLLDLLYPDRSGETDIPPDQAAALLASHADLTAAAKTLKAGRAALRARVLSALGPGDVLTADGRPVFTYRPQTRTGIALRDLKKGDPALYQTLDDGHWITTTSTRTLRAAHRGADDDE